MIKQLTLTAKPAREHGLTRLEMAKWLIANPSPNRCVPLTSKEAMEQVDLLVGGGTISFATRHDSPYTTCPFLDCKIEAVEDEYARAIADWQSDWAIADDLRERGAAGDAEAAIAFCKLNHAMLFAAYAG